MSQTPSLPSPDKWTDEMVLDFLSVGMRHVEIKGTLAYQDIRDGLAYVANKHAKAQAPQAERQASEAERAAITEAIGFEFQPGELQTVNEADLLRVYRAGLKDMPHWRRAIYNAEECLTGCLATNAFDGQANIETAGRIVKQLQFTRVAMLTLEGFGGPLAGLGMTMGTDRPQQAGNPAELSFAETLAPSVEPEAEQVDQDGWIKWDGGDCPVPHDCEVFYRMKSDTPRKSHVDLAAALDWKHHGGITGRSNIIAYKLKSPQKP